MVSLGQERGCLLSVGREGARRVGLTHLKSGALQPGAAGAEGKRPGLPDGVGKRPEVKSGPSSLLRRLVSGRRASGRGQGQASALEDPGSGKVNGGLLPFSEALDRQGFSYAPCPGTARRTPACNRSGFWNPIQGRQRPHLL